MSAEIKLSSDTDGGLAETAPVLLSRTYYTQYTTSANLQTINNPVSSTY